MINTLKTVFLLVMFLASPFLSAEVPRNFQQENLVVWCVVPPWDAEDRNPAQRSALLADMGLKRLAYNWAVEADFEAELEQGELHGIEFFAFWNESEEAFGLFKKRGIHPQIWKINPSPKVEGQQAKVKAAAEQMLPFARRAHELGSKFGLYNHGGWGGQPENLVAVCEELRRRGLDHVGVVYNFHHAHALHDRFAELFELMKPYLLCLNLNGMAAPESVDEKTMENKILPIGAGQHEATMIRVVIDSGYAGPIGIIGHLPEQDVEISLRDNLVGLDKVLRELVRSGHLKR